MTKLLEKAIKKIKDLSEDEQNNIARLIMDEVVWDELFDKSKDKLDILAKEIRQQVKEGKFKISH